MGQVYGVEAGWSYIEEDEYKNVLNCIVAERNEKRGQKVRSIALLSYACLICSQHYESSDLNTCRWDKAGVNLLPFLEVPGRGTTFWMTWRIWISEYGVNHEPLAR